jgi:hypothetical protein
MASDDEAEESRYDPPPTGGRVPILRRGVHAYRRDGPRTFLSKAIRFGYYRIRDELKTAVERPWRAAYAGLYDVTDRYWERTLATSTAVSGGRSVDFDGTTAVTTDRANDAVHVWGLGEPTEPTLSASVPAAAANHVSLDGDTACVTQRTGSGVLHVVDVPTATVVSTVESDGFGLTYGVDVDPDRGLAGVADRTGAIGLIDVDDPAAPRMLGVVEDESFRGATGVQFADEFLVVSAKDTSRLVVLDVTDPTAPTVATTLESERFDLVDPVAYHDGTLYTAAGSTWRPGLDADVDPTTVAWQFNAVGFEHPPELAPRGRVRDDDLARCYGIALEGGFAYASSMEHGQLVVLDVSDGHRPTVHDVGAGVEFWNVHDVAVADGVGVTVSTSGRLSTFSAYG